MQEIEKNGNGVYAIINTKKGDMIVRLAYQEAPLTVSNFVGLAEGTLNHKASKKPFYDGLTFHRVISKKNGDDQDFMIQGGDPDGTGSGGPGYHFPDEIVPELNHSQAGVLSMANAGPNTNGSQFFITIAPAQWLDGKHAVFGQLIAGLDVAQSISAKDVIESITIVRHGEEAKEFRVTQEDFDTQIKAQEVKNGELAQLKEAQMKKKIEELSQGAKKTDSGLLYFIRQKGKGANPKKGQTVVVHYEGRFVDDTIFDSSYKRSQPISLPVGEGQVIKGWEEALLAMKTGEKRTLIIPPQLAYGERGYPGAIPPDAWLIFEIELVKIETSNQ